MSGSMLVLIVAAGLPRSEEGYFVFVRMSGGIRAYTLAVYIREARY